MAKFKRGSKAPFLVFRIIIADFIKCSRKLVTISNNLPYPLSIYEGMGMRGIDHNWLPASQCII